jgi:hypothetical protein
VTTKNELGGDLTHLKFTVELAAGLVPLPSLPEAEGEAEAKTVPATVADLVSNGITLRLQFRDAETDNLVPWQSNAMKLARWEGKVRIPKATLALAGPNLVDVCLCPHTPRIFSSGV